VFLFLLVLFFIFSSQKRERKVQSMPNEQKEKNEHQKDISNV